jgi:ABC-type branched-subunit amino acid transport system ATPase component
VLEVLGIDVAYGPAKVLHGVSLTLNPGEMVFVVGRNGAGKTTLLQTISGHMRPSSGRILYDGKEIQGQPAEKLARLGIRFVAQDKKVFSNLTVRANIELASHATGENLEQAIQRLVRLYPKFQDSLGRNAGGLSGGQREILLIGRALVGNPRLLLIDEPTEGLAAIVIEDIFRILQEMKQKKVSTFIVEQNLSVVSRLADRIYIMKEGKIMKEMIDPAEIRNTNELESYL